MSLKILFRNLFVLQTIIISLCYYIEEKHHNKIKNNFAFGSCFYGRLSTRFDMFKTIQENNPELWVWLGDAAYSDLKYPLNKKIFDYEFSQDMFNKSKNNECKNNFNFLLLQTKLSLKLKRKKISLDNYLIFLMINIKPNQISYSSYF